MMELSFRKAEARAMLDYFMCCKPKEKDRVELRKSIKDGLSANKRSYSFRCSNADEAINFLLFLRKSGDGVLVEYADALLMQFKIFSNR